MTIWLLRWWPTVLSGMLCVLLVALSVAVHVNMPFAPAAVFAAATFFFMLCVASRYVPLDIGSYARRMRGHALAAYEIWQLSQLMVGRFRDELQQNAFVMIDRLFKDASICDRMLYRDMSEEEERFWCAYLRYRTDEEQVAQVSDRCVRRLYQFLRTRRTTEADRERLVARQVLGP